MTNTWYESNCPDCDKKNWVCDGDTSDLSEMDIEAVKCWNCGAVFDLAVGLLPDDDGAIATDGQQYPV